MAQSKVIDGENQDLLVSLEKILSIYYPKLKNSKSTQIQELSKNLEETFTNIRNILERVQIT